MTRTAKARSSVCAGISICTLALTVPKRTLPIVLAVIGAAGFSGTRECLLVHPSLDPEQWTVAVPDREVMVADGQQVKVTVRNGRLQVEDGVPGQRRSRELARVPREVTRLVILARRGYITLEALRWLLATKTYVTHVTDGEVIMTSGNGEGDPRMIHQQVKHRLDIARFLLSSKVTGQSSTLHYAIGPNRASEVLLDIARTLRESYNAHVNYLRGLEGMAAQMYWNAWQGHVRLPWSASDHDIVPPHWRSYPGRPTMVTSWETNRNATDPINAMLNYTYKILESETLNACRAQGLHPGLGVIHAGGTDRQAFVLDLMEPVRPFCDRLVLEWIKWPHPDPVGSKAYVRIGPYWDRRWQHEEANGRCVLDPPLTHVLAGWTADIGAAVMEYAVRVKGMYRNGNSD